MARMRRARLSTSASTTARRPPAARSLPGKISDPAGRAPAHHAGVGLQAQARAACRFCRADAAQLLAGDLARLSGADWDRALIYIYPERA
jgi:hypothetical protein